MQTGPILVIDDDTEDHDILEQVLLELGHEGELVFVKTAEEAVMRLRDTHLAPFIILCELNLHGINGFDLRTQLLEVGTKKFKSVPFIFWSTHASEAQITRAYDLSVHGFFIKEGSFNDLKDTFRCIINYWTKSKKPSKTIF